MNAKSSTGGAAAPALAEIAAGESNVAIEETEESLAQALAREDEESNASSGSATDADDENANAGADGDSSAETETESEDAESEDASEGEAEADSEPVLSQEQSEEEEPGEGAEAEAELQARIGKIPKLTPEQGQHVSEIIKERIGKVTRKLRETEEQATARVSELESRATQAEARVQELEGLTAGHQEGTSGDALADVTSIEALHKKAGAAQQVVDFCDDMLVLVKRQPQAVERELRRLNVKLTTEDGAEDYSPESMSAWLDEKRLSSNRRLTREIPQRGQFLQAEKKFSDEAMTKMPWLKDAKNPKTARFNELVKTFPVLKKFPAWRLLLARAVDHADAEAQAAAKPKNPPLVKPPTAKVKQVLPNTTVKGVKARPAKTGTEKSAELIAAEKELAESGSSRALERVIALEG